MEPFSNLPAMELCRQPDSHLSMPEGTATTARSGKFPLSALLAVEDLGQPVLKSE